MIRSIAKIGRLLTTPLKRFPNVTPAGFLIFGAAITVYKLICIAERGLEKKLVELNCDKGALNKLLDRFASGEFFPVEPEPG